MTRRSDGGRRGYVLLAVLIVVVVLSLAAYQFTEAMTSEYVAAARTTDVAQARAFAVSGVHFAAASLADPNTLDGTLGGNPYDNPGQFANVVVQPADGPRREGRFALVNVANTGAGSYEVRYGVADEGGKLNINALIQLDSTGQRMHDALMALPNMTEEIADAIVDWVDPDDTPRLAGAESDYYLQLAQPYRAKNGPLNSLDELLLVKGVTWQLLYGNDRNRNGRADDTADGQAVDRGWSDFLTVYGRELNTDGVGQQRLNLGESEDLPGFYSQLIPAVGQEMADYIMAYKLFGGSPVPTSTTGGSSSSGSSSGSGSSGTAAKTVQGTPQQLTAAVQAALTKSPKNKARIRSALSLINTQVTLPSTSSGSGSGSQAKGGNSSSGSSNSKGGSGSGSGQTQTPPTVVVASPLNDPGKLAELLPNLLDKTSGRSSLELTPRVNVRTAPREVLLAVAALQSASTTRTTGGTGTATAATGSSGSGRSAATLTEADVDAIIAARAGLSPTDPAARTAAWLVTTANLNPQVVARLERYVTGRTMVYRVQSIGYFGQGGPVARVEAVVDTNQGSPRFLYFRDLTDLDNPRGFEPPR